jgi:hypothetical protein
MSMTAEQQRNYASIILRLLVEGTIDSTEQRNVIWGDLLQISAQNGVLIRVVDQLETIGLEPRHFFSAAVREMRARNQRKLALISHIGERCTTSNIDFIFPKALQSYPDMPGDIDLYVTGTSLDIDRIILKGLQTKALKRTLRNRIEGTANYMVRGCDAPLEIHHGRVGMAGEHKSYISRLVENAIHARADGEDFVVPSPEDQLVLQALQRVVQRSYLRLSDVATTIGLVARNELNWEYVVRTVKELNIVYGLSCYLSFVEQIYREAFKDYLLPAGFLVPVTADMPRIEFSGGFFRFKRIEVGGRELANKFCSAMLAEDWAIASRLSLLPVVAMSTMFRKLSSS